jgi:lipid-binding SYLF domain-containing protein
LLLKLAGYQFGDFVGVQSCALAKVIANHKQFDAVWEI